MPYRRIDLPRPPSNMADLPRDVRGLPIPKFVSYLDGTPDFRFANQQRIKRLALVKACFICDRPLKSGQDQRDREGSAFIIGPVTALTRETAEPPSHLSCALYAVRVCPFMLDPKRHRRENNMPHDVIPDVNVLMQRNPGVMVVWVSDWRVEQDAESDHLFRLGVPSKTYWYTKGREATHTEVMAAFSASMPFLHANFTDHRKVEQLEREWYATVKPMIPPPPPKAKHPLTWAGGGVLVACLPLDADKEVVARTAAPFLGLDPDTMRPLEEAGYIVGAPWHKSFLSTAVRHLCEQCKRPIAVAQGIERGQAVGMFCPECFKNLVRENEAMP